MKKENVFELLRQGKGYAHTTNVVYFNEVGFYHDRTLYNRIRYEKERTIAKCRNRKKRTIKNWSYRRKQYTTIIHLSAVIKNSKKTIRSWSRGGDTNIQLSMFKKINDYTY